MASDQEPRVTRRPEPASPLVLNLELEAAQPRILSLFRECFLAWLKDRSASRFARDAGTPLHVTLEETGAGADHASTLRLSASWSQEAACPEEGLLPAVRPRGEPDRFKFFEDTQEKPLVTLEPALDDEEIASALRYAELMRRRPRPMARKLATRASVLARQSGGYASRAWRAAATLAAPYLLAARRLGARAAVFAARSMQSIRGLWAGGREAASIAAPSLRARRDAVLSSLGDLVERVRPSSASLRVPAILAAVSVLLVIGTVAFVLRDGRAGQDTANRTAAAVQPVGSSGASSIDRGAIDQPRAGTPRPEPQKTAQSTTVAVEPPAVQVPLRATKVSRVAPKVAPRVARRVAATRRTAALSPARRVKVRDRRPADTRAVVVGTLQVGSEPSGAEVFVNGVAQGRTPLTLNGLPPGSRVVRLDMPGYVRWSWSVAVVANRRTPVVVKLQPDTRRAGIDGAANDFTPRLP